MKTVFLFVVCVLLIPSLILAEGEALRGAGPRSYAFHLLFDNGKVSLDTAFVFPYSFLIEAYVPPPVPLQYRGEVLGFKNTPLARFTFDPKQEEHNFTKGKITVKAPYFPDAAKVTFYDNAGNPTLTIPVAKTAICNDNGACNTEYGENNTNCPQDCRSVIAPSPLSTSPTSQPNIPQQREYWSWKTMLAMVGIILVLAVLLVLRTKR